MKRLPKILLTALALLLTAAAIAPFIGAGRFSAVLHRRLEQRLGRQVDLRGDVHFRILPRPGFRIADPGGGSAAIIHERAEFGLEPLAYVEALELGVSLGALATGTIELASIRLVNPSLNLTKIEDRWNIQPILEHALQQSTLPDIEVDGGRLNFKTGDQKSSFYLAETSLSIDADSTDASRFGIRLEGEPARTDRATRAFGQLTARGMLSLGSPGGRPRVEMTVALERTPVAEIAALLTGAPTGLGGFVASRLRVSGELSGLAISGRIEPDQVERPSLLPRNIPAAGIQGKLDLPGQRIEIETQDSSEESFGVRLEGSSLFSRPRWSAHIRLRDYPIASARTLLEEVGAVRPGSLPLEGLLAGAMGWAPGGAAKGRFQLRQAEFIVPGQPALGLDDTILTVEGSRLTLEPPDSVTGLGEVKITGELDSASGAREIRVQARKLPIPVFRGLSERLLQSAPPVFLDGMEGSLSGNLTLRGESTQPQWTGQIRLEEATAPVPVGTPVLLHSALASFRGDNVDLRAINGSAGAMRFTGDYAFRPGKPHRHTAALRVEQSTLAQWRDMLAALPWQNAGNLELELKVADLAVDTVPLRNAQARVYARQGVVEVRDFAGQWRDATVEAQLTADLTGTPDYRGTVNLRGFDWMNGLLDVEGTLKATGRGNQAAWSLVWQGSFWGSGVSLPPHGPAGAIDGCFRYSQGGVELTTVSATTAGGATRWSGQGAVGSNGRLSLELRDSSQNRTLRLPAVGAAKEDTR